MNKKIITPLVIAIAILSFVSGYFFPHNLTKDLYATTMKIIHVVDDSHLICQTFSGVIYSFDVDDTEDWYEGDLVSTIMKKNHTPIIYDDDIIAYRYSGYVNEWGN